MTNRLDIVNQVSRHRNEAPSDRSRTDDTIHVGHDRRTGDEMKHDDTNHGEASPSSDEFWGSTPDWSTGSSRPRRQRSESSGDITGAIKGLWTSAISSGAGGTREHHVVDATAPRPADDTPVAGPTMFDDLDTEVPWSDSGRVPAVGARTSRFRGTNPTDEVPVIDAAGPPPGGVFDGDVDDDGFAEMTPVPLVERNDNGVGRRVASIRCSSASAVQQSSPHCSSRSPSDGRPTTATPRSRPPPTRR